MIPVFCRVKHEPENTSFGDCLRACVASILELKSEDVPHFFHDGCDGEIGFKRLESFLVERNLWPFLSCHDGSLPLNNFLEIMENNNPFSHYILFGKTENSGHCVVCRGGRVVHNPAWSGSPIVKPSDENIWISMVIAIK